MRLARFGDPGQEFPALIDAQGGVRDARTWVDDWAGDVLNPDNLKRLAHQDVNNLPLVSQPVRLGPCVGRVGKIVGVALNYRAHAEETGGKIPAEPHLFLKATSALCGPRDPLIMPPTATKLDWEVELGVVIGRTARHVTAATALAYVAGYCLLDDVSERAFQSERGGQQHTKGKSADSFCPIGPWVLTADEVADPQTIALWTLVNTTRMQNGNTAQMIYSVAALVAAISEFMTLCPGDVIASGTPDGVGKGMTPPCYLALGDVVTLGGDRLGEQRHVVIADTR